jgi:hypothetical protein
MNCHKKSREKKAGPIVCGDCHVEKLQSVTIKYPLFEFDYQVHDTHDKKLKERNIKETCDLCHHIYNEELVYERGKEWSCYYCHDIGKQTGPALAVETRNTKKKDFNIRRISHIRCLNCHLYFTLKEKVDPTGKKKVGPLICDKCHTGKYKTVAELEKCRPDACQPKAIQILKCQVEGVSWIIKYEKIGHAGLSSRDIKPVRRRSQGKPPASMLQTYHDVFLKKLCYCHESRKKKKIVRDVITLYCR